MSGDINFYKAHAKLLLNLLLNWREKHIGALPETTTPKATIHISLFEEKYLELIKGKTNSNVKASFKKLIEHFGDIQIGELKAEDLQKFYNQQRQRAHPAANDYINRLKTAFNRAVDFGYLQQNPFLKVRVAPTVKRERHFFSFSEMKAIIEAESNQTLKQFYLFAFDTGFRRGEILNMKWQGINFDEQMIYTLNDKDFKNKTRKDRGCPMTEALNNLLAEMFKEATRNNVPPPPDSYVFCKENGAKYNEDYITRKFKQACGKAGIKGNVTLHCTRHSFCTALLQSGADIYTVMSLAGHSRIETTAKYLHSNKQKQKEAISRFGEAERL